MESVAQLFKIHKKVQEIEKFSNFKPVGWRGGVFWFKSDENAWMTEPDIVKLSAKTFFRLIDDVEQNFDKKIPEIIVNFAEELADGDWYNQEMAKNSAIPASMALRELAEKASDLKNFVDTVYSKNFTITAKSINRKIACKFE